MYLPIRAGAGLPRHRRRTACSTPAHHAACSRSAVAGRPLAEVLDAVSAAEARLAQLRHSPAIADQPGRHWVDDWLHRSCLNFWHRSH
jgi:hypothetical protein